MLRRYLLRELVAPLLAWTAFLCLMFLVTAFLRGTDVLLGSAVTPWDFVRFLTYLGPQFLAQALPVAFLLALLLGLGRLSEDGELRAMQSLGVSPRAFFAAPLALGLGLTAVQVLLAFTAQPWGMASARGAANEIIRRNLMEDIRPGLFHEDMKGFTVYAERVDSGGRWGNVLLFDGRDPATPMLVVARAGAVRPGSAEDELSIGLFDGSIHRATRATDEYATVAFEAAEFRAGVGEAQFLKNRFSSAFEEVTPLELREGAREAKARGEDPLPLDTAFHWRLGQLLMPLAFAVLGAPLALVRRGGGRARGFVFTLLGFAGYYALARSGAQAAVKGQVPAVLGGQLANLVFVAVGLWLMRLTEKRGAV